MGYALPPHGVPSGGSLPGLRGCLPAGSGNEIAMKIRKNTRGTLRAGYAPRTDELRAGMVLRSPTGRIWNLFGFVDGVAELHPQTDSSYIDRTPAQLAGWVLAEPFKTKPPKIRLTT